MAIKKLTDKYPDVDFVYPMHLNPNVREPIHKVFDKYSTSNMFFIEPLEYLSFIYLMEKSAIVLTDSGGIQEEAPGLGIPVLVMRDTTERPEALEAGTVKLVGTDYDKIVAEDALSRELNGIKNYLLRRSSFITDIIQEKYDLKQENINLKEKYEELENKYKNMERNFYDAFS